MNKIITTLILIFTSFFIIGGCGGSGNGSDEPCDFDIFTVTNGTDQNNIDSFWECVSPELGEFDFSIFDDGTGLSPFIDEFTWIEIDCDSLFIESENLSVDAVDIDLTDGILTFTFESSETLADTNVMCELIEL